MSVYDDYPFPLASGSLAWLRIPRGELTAADVARLSQMATTLAIPTTYPHGSYEECMAAGCGLCAPNAAAEYPDGRT